MATRDQIETASRPPERNIPAFVNTPGDHVLYQPHAPELDAAERRRAVAFIRRHSGDPGVILAALGLDREER